MNFSDTEMRIYRLEPGDLLLSEASGSAAEVGKPALWEGQIPDCAFQNTLIRVRPRDSADSRYLLHYFSHCATSGRFARSSRGVGIFHLGQRALTEWPVPLPPLEEQRRIAAVLDAADALRAKRRQALAKVDTLAQAMFVDTFRNTEAPSVELGDVAEVQGGLQVTSKRRNFPLEVPYLRVANVYRALLDLDEVKTIRVTARELERTKLEVGDLLVVEGHGNPEEIGRVAIWDGSIDRCVHQNHLIRVRCASGTLEPRFAESYLNSWVGRRSLLRAANTTSGLNTISTGDVRSVRIPLAGRSEQQRFVQVAETIDTHRSVVSAHARSTDELLASLHQRAFRGEL